MVKVGWRSITAVIYLLHAVTRDIAYRVHAPVQDRVVSCANAGYSVSSWFYLFELLTKLSNHAHGQSWVEIDNSGN